MKWKGCRRNLATLYSTGHKIGCDYFHFGWVVLFEGKESKARDYVEVVVAECWSAKFFPPQKIFPIRAIEDKGAAVYLCETDDMCI